MFEAISRCYHERGGQRVRLCATAALTNVALLLILYPEVVEMVEVVVMGGAMGIGNTAPVAEFNIQTDPEAAKVRALDCFRFKFGFSWFGLPELASKLAIQQL